MNWKQSAVKSAEKKNTCLTLPCCPWAHHTTAWRRGLYSCFCNVLYKNLLISKNKYIYIVFSSHTKRRKNWLLRGLLYSSLENALLICEKLNWIKDRNEDQIRKIKYNSRNSEQLDQESSNKYQRNLPTDFLYLVEIQDIWLCRTKQTESTSET